MPLDQLNLLHAMRAPVEYMCHIVEAHDGWYLRIAHRHPDGTFGECPTDNYQRLTLAEALDVIAVSLVLEEDPF